MEIQALRALAVLVVLLYHIWPSALPGGYVGVDVFFVISGYLITGILFKQFSSTGAISLSDFYVRRIRRLLPAAVVVLVAVALFLPLLPRTQWEENAAGIVASTLYVQNWWLAGQAVDYLAAESAPSVVQHFWSLSVEEQYYIGWPLLLMLVTLLPAAWKRNPGRIFSLLVLAVVVLSLAYSVWLTRSNPGLAYFSTLTRAWELGIGGLLAVTTSWRSLPQGVRDTFAWAGLAMIIIAVAVFDETTAFPGYAAALPVVGTALVLIAGESTRWYSAYGILRLRPLQYFGDISYSLYLWHWPVIVFYSALSGRPPSLLDGIAMIAVAIALAHQSKTLVEDSFRVRQVDRRTARLAFGIAAGSIVVCLGAAWMAPRPWVEGAPALARASGSLPNPGALVLTHDVAAQRSAVVPALSLARKDMPAPYADKCMSRGSRSELAVCEYGDREGARRMLLVGDVQAAQWQPALEDVALANSWKLDVAVKAGCILGDAVPAREGKRFSPCEEWREALVRHIRATAPDVVIVAQTPTAELLGGETGTARTSLLSTSLEQFAASVSPVPTQLVFIRSVPNLGRRCADEDAWEACGKPRVDAVRKGDPVLEASRAIPGVALVDMSDAICAPDRCEAVVGSVAVYRAPGLLTATYARSTAAAMARQLARGVGWTVKAPSLQPAGPSTDLMQQAIAAKRDNPDLYNDGCHVNQSDPPTPRHCTYGDQDSATKVVLVGDSHAGQWQPALREIAVKRGWKLYTHTKSACAFSETAVTVRGREYTACTEWNRALMDELRQLSPDIIITSQSRQHQAWGAGSKKQSRKQLADGLVKRWSAAAALGAQVFVIADTPWMEENVPDCLTGVAVSSAMCATPLSVADGYPDPILHAARAAPGVTLLKMNEYICDASTCPAVKDGEIVWRDRHHLTATFARSLAPVMEAAIAKSLN